MRTPGAVELPTTLPFCDVSADAAWIARHWGRASGSQEAECGDLDPSSQCVVWWGRSKMNLVNLNLNKFNLSCEFNLTILNYLI